MDTLTQVRPTQTEENSTEHNATLEKIRQADQSEIVAGFSTNGASYEHITLNGSTLDSYTQVMPSTPTPEDNDPFYYGWRYEYETLPDGTTKLKQIPLPPERFLNPQEGDHFMQSNKHHTLAGSIHNKYENRYDDDDSVGVFSDLKMVWGVSGLDEPAPDVAVVPNLKNPEKHRGTFKVPEEGTKPILIVEVTSPTYPFDEDKVPTYEQVGVQEYIIVDPHWGSDDALEFFGYHLVGGSYQPMQKDSQGRLYSATTDTYISFETGEGDEIIAHVTDGTTGEPILDNKESHRARLDAEERVQVVSKKADAAEERAKAALEKAETEAAERRKLAEQMAEAMAEIERLRVLTVQSSSE